MLKVLDFGALHQSQGLSTFGYSFHGHWNEMMEPTLKFIKCMFFAFLTCVYSRKFFKQLLQ